MYYVHCGSAKIHPILTLHPLTFFSTAVSARAHRFGDAPDARDISGQTQIHVFALGDCPNLVGRVDHDFLQTRVDFIGGPEILVAALHPLEIAHRDAARVGQNVGHDSCAVCAQNRVSVRRCRAVGGFDEQFCFDIFRI